MHRVKDLDGLPQPDPALWPGSEQVRSEVWLPFETRRGCPNKCSYCATASITGTALRLRHPKSVVASIARHVGAGYRRFFCTDNTFNLPMKYARKICDLIAKAELGIAWQCILYPSRIDEAFAVDMARAGCISASLGFESGSTTILEQMRKRFTPDDVRRTAAFYRKHGIQLEGFVLLGGPGETRETVLETLAFADSLPLDFLFLTSGMRIYPGTELARIAVAEGVIEADDDLLLPRFYRTRGLEGWLEDEIARWTSDRPHWVV